MNAIDDADDLIEMMLRVDADITTRKKAGARYPIRGSVKCPRCAEGQVEYRADGPRSLRAACVCGVNFLS